MPLIFNWGRRYGPIWTPIPLKTERTRMVRVLVSGVCVVLLVIEAAIRSRRLCLVDNRRLRRFRQLTRGEDCRDPGRTRTASPVHHLRVTASHWCRCTRHLERQRVNCGAQSSPSIISSAHGWRTLSADSDLSAIFASPSSISVSLTRMNLAAAGGVFLLIFPRN